MKTATIPTIRVEPDFRAEVQAVLTESETISQFVEASVRASVERRLMQAEFIARALRSRDEARRMWVRRCRRGGRSPATQARRRAHMSGEEGQETFRVRLTGDACGADRQCGDTVNEVADAVDRSPIVQVRSGNAVPFDPMRPGWLREGGNC